jgi:hypothetical protein
VLPLALWVSAREGNAHAWQAAFVLITTRATLVSIAHRSPGIVIPWAAVGFTGLSGYPHLLGLIERAHLCLLRRRAGDG